MVNGWAIQNPKSKIQNPKSKIYSAPGHASVGAAIAGKNT
jgi:hypothetical protein